jgi:outer membrane protein assembly factor BamB
MAEICERWTAPFRPNGLQAASDGLWVIAQSGGVDTDTHLYKLSYEDGSVIEKVPTDLEHAGGVTVGGGFLWVTAGFDLFKLDRDGATVESYLTPGGGGAHGVEWIDDNGMWIVQPRAFVHLVDPASMDVIRSVPTPPGKKTHGMFFLDGALWCGVTRKDTGGGELYKIDAETGEVLHRIDIPEPEVHGMTQHDGNIWFCCARTHRVCTVPLPL